jgi:hypothetical protein
MRVKFLTHINKFIFKTISIIIEEENFNYICFTVKIWSIYLALLN